MSWSFGIARLSGTTEPLHLLAWREDIELKPQTLFVVIPFVALVVACGSSTPPSVTPDPGTPSSNEPGTSAGGAPAAEPAPAASDGSAPVEEVPASTAE
jgi:hypothetical protein